jgi:hypothetical protein
LFQETQTKLIGRHTLRYGLEFVRQLSKVRAGFNERGALLLSAGVTFFAVFPRRLFQRRWIWALIWLPSVLNIAFYYLLPVLLQKH